MGAAESKDNPRTIAHSLRQLRARISPVSAWWNTRFYGFNESRERQRFRTGTKTNIWRATPRCMNHDYLGRGVKTKRSAATRNEEATPRSVAPTGSSLWMDERNRFDLSSSRLPIITCSEAQNTLLKSIIVPNSKRVGSIIASESDCLIYWRKFLQISLGKRHLDCQVCYAFFKYHKMIYLG